RDDRHATAAELADALEPFAAPETSASILLPTRREASYSGPLPTHERPTDVATTRDMAVPTPPPEVPPGAMDDEPMTESQLRGEVIPRTFGRNVALGLGGVAVAAAAFGFVFMGRARRHASPTTQPVAAAPESPIVRGKRLLGEGDLDGADKILRTARESSDSSELQEAMSEVAEQLGNRLGALAHMHRAIRISPDDPE